MCHLRWVPRGHMSGATEQGHHSFLIPWQLGLARQPPRRSRTRALSDKEPTCLHTRALFPSLHSCFLLLPMPGLALGTILVSEGAFWTTSSPDSAPLTQCPRVVSALARFEQEESFSEACSSSWGGGRPTFPYEDGFLASSWVEQMSA